MTTTLTLSKEAARFSELFYDDPLVASSFHLAIGAAAKSSDPDAKMQAWLADRGFATTMMEVLGAMGEAQQNDLGLWRSTYELKGEGGASYKLVVHNRHSVTLDGVTLVGFTFKNRTLEWRPTAPQLTTGSLTFTLSEGAEEARADKPRRVSLTVSGTITPDGQPARAVSGTTAAMVLGDGTPDLPEAQVNSLVPFNGTYRVKLFEGAKAVDAADLVMALDAKNGGTLTFGFDLKPADWGRNGDNSLVWSETGGRDTHGDIQFSESSGIKRFEGRIWTGDTPPLHRNAVGTFVDPEKPAPGPDPLDHPAVNYTNPFIQTGLTLLGSLLTSIGVAAFPAIWQRFQDWRERKRIAGEKGESLASYERELREMTPHLLEHTRMQRHMLELLQSRTVSNFVSQSEKLERMSAAVEREVTLLNDVIKVQEKAVQEAMTARDTKKEALDKAADLYREAKVELLLHETEEARKNEAKQKEAFERAEREHKDAEERVEKETERHDDLKEHHDHIEKISKVLKR